MPIIYAIDQLNIYDTVRTQPKGTIVNAAQRTLQRPTWPGRILRAASIVLVLAIWHLATLALLYFVGESPYGFSLLDWGFYYLISALLILLVCAAAILLFLGVAVVGQWVWWGD